MDVHSINTTPSSPEYAKQIPGRYFYRVVDPAERFSLQVSTYNGEPVGGSAEALIDGFSSKHSLGYDGRLEFKKMEVGYDGSKVQSFWMKFWSENGDAQYFCFADSRKAFETLVCMRDAMSALIDAFEEHVTAEKLSDDDAH